MKHVILGAGGVIANSLTQALLAQHEEVVLVSRTPEAIVGTITRAADVTNAEQVQAACQGADVIYLVAGLKYSTRVWQETWPVVMNNAIAVAQETGARLVFFDNVYAYGPVDGPMTEATPYNPTSKKGQVRKEISERLLDEAKAGNIQAVILRAADFYGPGTLAISFTGQLLFEPLKKGRRPQWMGDPNQPHTYTYTPDCGPAIAHMVRYGTNADWNRIWHLPSANPGITAHQMADIARQVMPGRPGIQVMGRTLIKALGLFMPFMREIPEMMYQYEKPYHFDSTAFTHRFNVEPTPYADGIKRTAESWL